MSDDEDEYEYEYDEDDMQEDDDEDEIQYTDDEEDGPAADSAEIALENAYYNAKGLRDESSVDAVGQAFRDVMAQEAESPGPWTFKSLKQLVKWYLRHQRLTEVLDYYQRLLECAASGSVSPNAVEKGIGGMLERVASLYQQQQPSSSSADPRQLARQIYQATLPMFAPGNPDSPCPNERLWFKTNLKLGQLLYELGDTAQLSQVLQELLAAYSSNTTQRLEIYALQMQLYSRQENVKKVRQTYHQAMALRGGLPHPRTLAVIHELGGQMYMSLKDYKQAASSLFQAFKSFDEAGDPSRLRCLKCLVLASMLEQSTINPFDSQEARPYRDDPEIVAMTNLVQAFHDNDIVRFEKVLKQARLLDQNDFMRAHLADLLRTIRAQVLVRILRPYTRIRLEALARQLNHMEHVEDLVVNLILDGTIDGKLDRVQGVLLLSSPKTAAKALSPAQEEQSAAVVQLAKQLEAMGQQLANTVRANETGGSSGGSGLAMRSVVH